jgi:hypothetical protein
LKKTVISGNAEVALATLLVSHVANMRARSVGVN